MEHDFISCLPTELESIGFFGWQQQAEGLVQNTLEYNQLETELVPYGVCLGVNLRIEIAKPECRKLFLQAIKPLANAKRFSVFRQSEAFDIPFRIHIQIAQLDEIGMMVADKCAQ